MNILYNPISKMAGYEDGTNVVVGTDLDNNKIVHKKTNKWIYVTSSEEWLVRQLTAMNSMSSNSISSYVRVHSAMNLTVSKVENWIGSNWSLASLFGAARSSYRDGIRIHRSFPVTLLVKSLPDRKEIEKSLVCEALLTRGPMTRKALLSVVGARDHALSDALASLQLGGFVTVDFVGGAKTAFPTPLLTGEIA